MSNSDRDKLTKAEELDFYYKLAERSEARLNFRRAIEWRISMGLWAAFAAGTYAVIMARDWNPGCSEICWGIILGLVAVVGHFCWFIKYLNRRNKEDRNTANKWDQRIRKELDCESDEGEQNNSGSYEECCGLHIAQLMQVFATLVFALLFVGALTSKAFSS